MIDKETERRLSRIEQAVGLPKGITESPTDKIRASFVGPLVGMPKEEKSLDELLQEIQKMIRDAVSSTIENRLGDLQGDVYEIIEEYNSNPNNISQTFRNILVNISPKIHKAYCKAAAGAATTIVCYLDTDATGEEITVNCDTNGGGNLNVSVPLLKDGQLLYVVKIAGSWCALEKFNTGQTAIAFVKTTPGAVTSVACWFSETDGTGEEISVPCDIVGSGNLNACFPLLVDGEKIQVAKNGTTWRCVSALFQEFDTTHFQISGNKLLDKLDTCA